MMLHQKNLALLLSGFLFFPLSSLSADDNRPELFELPKDAQYFGHDSASTNKTDLKYKESKRDKKKKTRCERLNQGKINLQNITPGKLSRLRTKCAKISLLSEATLGQDPDIGGSLNDSCTPSGSSPNPHYEWIKQVKIGSFTKDSSKSSYSNFRPEGPVLKANRNTTYKLTAGFLNNSVTQVNFQIFVDSNRDGAFSAGERVLLKNNLNPAGGTPLTSVSGSMLIPDVAETGNYNMRVIMSYYHQTIPNGCGPFQFWGEIEDYTAHIVKYERTSAVTFSGNSGVVGQNLNEIFNTQDNLFSVTTNAVGTNSTHSQIRFRVIKNGSTKFDLQLHSPNGQHITPGVYRHAESIPATTSKPGIKLLVNGKACSAAAREEGEFIIRHIAIHSTTGKISELVADLKHKCLGDTSYSTASLYFNFDKPVHCSPGNYNSSLEFIEKVNLDGQWYINDIHADSNQDYYDPDGNYSFSYDEGHLNKQENMTNHKKLIMTSNSSLLELSPSFPTGGSYNQNWRAFIDYNNDGILSPSELVLSLNNKSETVSGAFEIPATLGVLPTTMRVYMNYAPSDSTTICGADHIQSGGEIYGFWGQVHDITIKSNLEDKCIFNPNFHNVKNPLDVNNDGRVSAVDALLIANLLNSSTITSDGPHQLIGRNQSTSGQGSLVDVNKDGCVSAEDAEIILNHLNS